MTEHFLARNGRRPGTKIFFRWNKKNEEKKRIMGLTLAGNNFVASFSKSWGKLGQLTTWQESGNRWPWRFLCCGIQCIALFIQCKPQSNRGKTLIYLTPIKASYFLLFFLKLIFFCVYDSIVLYCAAVTDLVWSVRFMAVRWIFDRKIKRRIGKNRHHFPTDKKCSWNSFHKKELSARIASFQARNRQTPSTPPHAAKKMISWCVIESKKFDSTKRIACCWETSSILHRSWKDFSTTLKRRGIKKLFRKKITLKENLKRWWKHGVEIIFSWSSCQEERLFIVFYSFKRNKRWNPTMNFFFYISLKFQWEG